MAEGLYERSIPPRTPLHMCVNARQHLQTLQRLHVLREEVFKDVDALGVLQCD